MLILKEKKILFEKKILCSNYFTAESDVVLDNILSEARGIFPQQVELTHYLSKCVVNMIRSNITKQKYDLTDYLPFQNVTLILNLPNNKLWNGYIVSGELTELSDEHMVITVKIPRFDILALGDNSLQKKIEPCIAHELNHAYVALKKYFNSGTSVIMPNYYDNALSLYRSENQEIPTQVKDFAYLIYSTNPYEIQARISQVYQELNDIIKEKPLTIETLKKALNLTDTYQTFFDNTYYASNIVEKYLNNNIDNVIYWFSEFGINFQTKESIFKLFKQTIKDSKNALKAIGKIAMDFFYRKNLD